MRRVSPQPAAPQDRPHEGRVAAGHPRLDAAGRALASLVEADRAARAAGDPSAAAVTQDGVARAAGDPSAAVVPKDAAEVLARLALAAAGRAPVDDDLLDGAEALTAVWARAFLLLPPAALAHPVRAHVDRLAALLDGSLAPGARARLGSLVGDGAAFAGALAVHLHRDSEARAWYALARDAARDAGDDLAHACALEGLGAVASTASTAGQGGDARAARALAQAAAAALPAGAPGTIRAWIAFREAVEHAVAGDAMACHRSIDRAEAALAGGWGTGSARRGFLSDEGRFRLCLRPEYSSAQRGWSLMQLSSPAAVPLLRRAARSADPALRGGAQADLAELCARRDDRDEAVAWASAALGTAQELRYPYGVHVVRSIRHLMDGWDPLPALRDLDDRLAAA